MASPVAHDLYVKTLNSILIYLEKLFLTMPKNVTYLFGAGASANALPVVKYFNPRLELFLKYLENLPKNLIKTKEFIPEVRLILEEAKHHSTIDTVAKKYFH